MTATIRRAFGTLMLVIVMAIAGSMLTPSAAHARGSGTTTGKAGGSVGVLGEHFVRYCVHGFEPGSTVTVTNTTLGKSVTLVANSQGKGCVEVPIQRECKANTETIVATGTGANGKPATVTSTVTIPATPSLCSSSSGGTLPFTGSNIIIPGLIIGLVLIGAGGGLMVVRRRREDGTPA